MKTESDAWARTEQHQHLGPRCWLFCSGVGSGLWGVGMCGAATRLESGAWVNAERPWSWGVECRSRWSYCGSGVKCAQVWKVLAALAPGHHHSSFFPTCAAVMAKGYLDGKAASVLCGAGCRGPCPPTRWGPLLWKLQLRNLQLSQGLLRPSGAQDAGVLCRVCPWGPPWSLFCGSYPFSLFLVVLRHLH